MKEYLSDPMSNFSFSLSAYYDMIKVLKKINSRFWFKHFNKDLPVFFASGSMDPVGQYGKGVCWIYENLEKNKVKDIKINLYPKAFHELHNEKKEIQKEFFNNLLNWLNSHL